MQVSVPGSAAMTSSFIPARAWCTLSLGFTASEASQPGHVLFLFTFTSAALPASLLDKLLLQRLMVTMVLLSTKRTVTHQSCLSMGFSRQAYWSGLPFPSSGDPPDPSIKPNPLTSLALAGKFFTTSATWEESLSI